MRGDGTLKQFRVPAADLLLVSTERAAGVRCDGQLTTGEELDRGKCTPDFRKFAPRFPHPTEETIFESP